MEKDTYIRVGTLYYKVVEVPLTTGGTVVKRIPWNVETIKQDFGKDYISQIPKYDGFCTIPNHTHYQKVINNFLNRYEPVEHTPQPGDCSVTLSFIKHIFGDQYELGLDYIQLLYTNPCQKLPILLLVSRERNTGKTTFLNFLKTIFKANMTFNTNEDFRSQFNDDWTGKLIIAVDEVLLNRREDSERLKNLSTAINHKAEAKGKDRREIEFFGKFILCSNNDKNPVIIDKGETRYWVRRIYPFEKENTRILSLLKKEVPHFIYLLLNRALSSGEKPHSRMWFTPEQIRTEGLQKIIRYNRNRYEMEFAEILLEIIEETGGESFSFCLNDMVRLLNDLQIKISRQVIKSILEEWKLSPAANSLSYTTYVYHYHSDNHYKPEKRKGRFYTVTKSLLLNF